MFFLIDCETTGSKRNWDRGISYVIFAYDKHGKLLGMFEQQVNNGHIPIKERAFAVHGISAADLADAPPFERVGRDMNVFFDTHLGGHDAGVLVAHNGATDFQFLSCDYIRAGLKLPAKITHTICTLQVIYMSPLKRALNTCSINSPLTLPDDQAIWISCLPQGKA